MTLQQIGYGVQALSSPKALPHTPTMDTDLARRSAPLPASKFDVTADTVLLATIGFGTLVAIAIGFQYEQLPLALLVGGVLLAVATAVYVLARGTLASSLVMAVATMSVVELQIQLAAGAIELHFGIFVTLALLLFYRDWRPILAGAVSVAVHHFAFDRLQALGFGVYCTPQADFWRVAFHAGYVGVQASMEMFIAHRMALSERQGAELSSLVASIEHYGKIALDAAGVRATTPAAISLRRVLVHIEQAVMTVQASATGVSTASTQIASGNQDLSQRTEQTASSLQVAASAMEELTGTVQQTAESARTADQLASTAFHAASEGGKVVSQVVATMDEINTSSRRIADIIGLIDGIAFQTNILALNAAVEAARAGEQGRGFAVVAGEVRSLAQRTAEAAKEIKTLIGESVARVDAGAQLVSEAGNSMTEIVASVQRVSDIIGQITAASIEQSGGIGSINESVLQLDQMTQQNAALVEQSAAAAQSLCEQAQHLAQAVSVFCFTGRAGSQAHSRARSRLLIDTLASAPA